MLLHPSQTRYCVADDEVLSFCGLNESFSVLMSEGPRNEQKLLKIGMVYEKIINQCFLLIVF